MNGNSRECNIQELKSVVREIEGIQVILEAMKRHQASRLTQLEAFKALHSLSCGAQSNAQLLVTKLDGIPLIIEAMKIPSGDVRVVEMACAILLNLVNVKELRKPMLDTNVASALACTIEGHKGCEGI